MTQLATKCRHCERAERYDGDLWDGMSHFERLGWRRDEYGFSVCPSCPLEAPEPDVERHAPLPGQLDLLGDAS